MTSANILLQLDRARNKGLDTTALESMYWAVLEQEVNQVESEGIETFWAWARKEAG